MKTVAFKYTKKDSSVSERLVLALSMPSNKLTGIDLSDMEPEAAEQFAIEAKELHEAYLNDMKQLQAKYDLNHNFRQFLDSGITQLDSIS